MPIAPPGRRISTSNSFEVFLFELGHTNCNHSNVTRLQASVKPKFGLVVGLADIFLGRMVGRDLMADEALFAPIWRLAVHGCDDAMVTLFVEASL